MLTLVTGTPGSGKTLWTIREIKRIAETQQRAVYYSHIPGLALDWTLLEDPRRWHELVPTGAILVIDEAWKYFPAVATGSKRPPYIEAFAEHRHKGIDIFLLTQHGTQIDTFARKMADHHVFLRRNFQMQSSKIFKWQRVVADPHDKETQGEAVTEFFPFPKEIFGLYKSADMHTKTQRPPWKKLLALPALVAVLAAAIFFGYRSAPGTAETASVPDPLQFGGVAGSAVPSFSSSDFFHPERWEPLYSGVPGSAPAYNGLHRVASAPRIEGCSLLEFGNGVRRCICNDQQGQPIHGLETGDCVQLVRGGWFRYWESDSETRARQDRASQRREAREGSSGVIRRDEEGAR